MAPGTKLPETCRDWTAPSARWPSASECPRWKRGGEVGEKSVVALLPSMDPGYYGSARHRRRIEGQDGAFPREPRFNDVGPGSVGTHTEADVNRSLHPGKYPVERYDTFRDTERWGRKSKLMDRKFHTAIPREERFLESAEQKRQSAQRSSYTPLEHAERIDADFWARNAVSAPFNSLTPKLLHGPREGSPTDPKDYLRGGDGFHFSEVDRKANKNPRPGVYPTLTRRSTNPKALPAALRRPSTTAAASRGSQSKHPARPSTSLGVSSNGTQLSKEPAVVCDRDPGYPGVDRVEDCHPESLQNLQRPTELFEVPYVLGVQGMRSFSKGRVYMPFRTRSCTKTGFESKSYRDMLKLCTTPTMWNQDLYPGKYSDGISEYYNKMQWGRYSEACQLQKPASTDAALQELCSAMHGSQSATSQASVQGKYHTLHRVSVARTKLEKEAAEKEAEREKDREQGRVPSRHTNKKRRDSVSSEPESKDKKWLISKAFEEYYRNDPDENPQFTENPDAASEFMSRTFITLYQEHHDLCSEQELSELYWQAMDQIQPMVEEPPGEAASTSEGPSNPEANSSANTDTNPLLGVSSAPALPADEPGSDPGGD